MNEKDIIYHYTSLEKFKCILQYGTLRFKESTTSNDLLDTTLLFDVLKEYDGLPDYRDTVEVARKFMLDYYQKFKASNQHISLVSCFAKEGDSRMLWDAYTMNHPSNIKCAYGDNRYCYDSDIRYNGVCIGFSKSKLEKQMRSFEGKVCERSYLFPVIYGKDKAKEKLNSWFSEACAQVELLSKDSDQKQDLIDTIIVPGFTGRPLLGLDLKKSLVYPMSELIAKIDAFSPYFKHEFWNEEEEICASLCFHKNKVSDLIEQCDGDLYFDMPITEDCIEYIILGPEFSNLESEEILSHSNYKLDFNTFEKRNSIGAGIIRSK